MRLRTELPLLVFLGVLGVTAPTAAEVPNRLRIGGVEIALGDPKVPVLERLRKNGYAADGRLRRDKDDYAIISTNGRVLGVISFKNDRARLVSVYLGSPDQSAFDAIRAAYALVKARFGEGITAAISTSSKSGDSLNGWDIGQDSWEIIIAVPEKGWFVTLSARQGKVDGKHYEDVGVMETIVGP